METAVFSASAATSELIPAQISTTSIAAARQANEGYDGEEDILGDGKKRSSKMGKRRKVNHACLYCRRSHMTCDEGRPCQRCIKREIGHLCHDESKPGKQNTTAQPQTPALTPATLSSTSATATSYSAIVTPTPSWPSISTPQSTYLYPTESFGRDFSSLSDRLLETLDEQTFIIGGTLNGTDAFGNVLDMSNPPNHSSSDNTTTSESSTFPGQQAHPQVNDLLRRYVDLVPPVLPSASMTEKFLLTAADPAPGTRVERLERVIRTKYEAGLMKPYNYAKGYARLSRWLDCNVSRESKQQILQPLSVLRPKFHAIAQSLRDMDLVLIEEAFERMLLDYDRFFACMGIPACLWRRTGEIYKGNREFAELVGMEGYMLRDGRLCIYELMTEESAVNYWEKYCNIAFDSSQKAVLTSCVLRFKPVAKHNPGTTTPGRAPMAPTPGREGLVNCCFSFTIRRDTWGIPLMIVGNFIRC
ncbi:hypothetical protein BGY98DRAFT_947848 [Russula aff. rugulosa BPL654]|nr:hypothetical protein BGY98DRAFT_947848 [Russula aff. rugulosa BPL654]